MFLETVSQDVAQQPLACEEVSFSTVYINTELSFLLLLPGVW